MRPSGDLDWGLLVLDKPVGITSHTAVQRVRRALGVAKAGHAGTLDPAASGVLLIGLGRATRLLEYLVGHDKDYRARVRLGEVRDTLDREGELLARNPVPALTAAEVAGTLARFRGPLQQIPPVYSAVKVGGQPMHRRARRGESLAPEPRAVEVHRLELAELALPDVVLDITCSAGTYVRSLARDLGDALGTGATLWELRRTRSGPFGLDRAVSLERLEAADGGWTTVLPPERMVDGLPHRVLDRAEVERVSTGRALSSPGEPGERVALFDEGGQLVAVARREGDRLHPGKVLRPAAPGTGEPAEPPRRAADHR